MKYTPLQKINIFLNIYGRMFSGIFHFSAWSGFFYLALFQALGLFALARFYLGGIYQVISPILSYFVPEALLHYPQYYLALPTLYSGFENFVLGPTIWVILSAFAVYKLDAYHRREKAGSKKGFKIALNAYLPLLIFWALETGLVLIAIVLPSRLTTEIVAGSPNRKIALEVGLQVGAYIISAFLIYTIPGVIIGSKRVGSAIVDSLVLCKRNFFMTVTLVLLPSLVRIAFDLTLSQFSPVIIKLLNPEIVLVLLGAQIFVGIFVNLFIYGSAVFVYKELNRS